jgi:hypothetical protein
VCFAIGWYVLSVVQLEAILAAFHGGVKGQGMLQDGTYALMEGMMRNGIETGFILDQQWYWLQGEMERTKRPALLALAKIFAEADVPYAIIGGVALQFHQTEPRTTLDIAVAVATYGQLPRAQLEAAGFTWSGRFSYSENWLGPEDTPVQFTDDPALADAITRAEDVVIEDVCLRVIGRTDLLHEKLRAAADPARRRSKRLQDLADAQALLESTPALTHELSAAERALLDQLPQ